MSNLIKNKATKGGGFVLSGDVLPAWPDLAESSEGIMSVIFTTNAVEIAKL